MDGIILHFTIFMFNFSSQPGADCQSEEYER